MAGLFPMLVILNETETSSSIHIDSESAPAKTYLIYSHPSSLAGNQCLSGHIGGPFGGIGECLVSFDHNFVLLAR